MSQKQSPYNYYENKEFDSRIIVYTNGDMGNENFEVGWEDQSHKPHPPDTPVRVSRLALTGNMRSSVYLAVNTGLQRESSWRAGNSCSGRNQLCLRNSSAG